MPFASTPELETARLMLRPLAMADAAQVQRLFPRWEIVRFLNARVPWPFPEDGVEAYYREAALPAMERGEEWHWTLRLRSAPGQIIGAIGLNRDSGNQHGGNRGFWLAPEWQRQGLMREAVAAVNDFWFDVLGFGLMRTVKAVANHSSRRISEATGMRLASTEEHDFVCGTEMAEVWEITAEEWHAVKIQRT